MSISKPSFNDIIHTSRLTLQTVGPCVIALMLAIAIDLDAGGELYKACFEGPVPIIPMLLAIAAMPHAVRFYEEANGDTDATSTTDTCTASASAEMMQYPAPETQPTSFLEAVAPYATGLLLTTTIDYFGGGGIIGEAVKGPIPVVPVLLAMIVTRSAIDVSHFKKGN